MLTILLPRRSWVLQSTSCVLQLILRETGLPRVDAPASLVVSPLANSCPRSLAQILPLGRASEFQVPLFCSPTVSICVAHRLLKSFIKIQQLFIKKTKIWSWIFNSHHFTTLIWKALLNTANIKGSELASVSFHSCVNKWGLAASATCECRRKEWRWTTYCNLALYTIFLLLHSKVWMTTSFTVHTHY